MHRLQIFNVTIFVFWVWVQNAQKLSHFEFTMDPFSIALTNQNSFSMKLIIPRLTHVSISIAEVYLTPILSFSLLIKSLLDPFHEKRSKKISRLQLHVKHKSNPAESSRWRKVAESHFIRIKLNLASYRSFKCKLKCLLMLNSNHPRNIVLQEHFFIFISVQFHYFSHKNTLSKFQSEYFVSAIINKYSLSMRLFLLHSD